MLVIKWFSYFLIYKIFLGLFIYACRLQLALSNVCDSYGEQAAAAIIEDESLAECKERATTNKGASGDHD